MFGKKVLSIVALLYTATQLVSGESVAAPEIVECPVTATYNSSTECSNTGDAVTYCYKDNTLFGFPYDDSEMAMCNIKLVLTLSSVNVINIGTSAITNINNSLADLNGGSIGRVVIYDCDASSCERISGIVKQGSANYYKIGISNSDDTGFNLVDQEKKYLVFDGTSNEGIVYSYQVDSGSFEKAEDFNAPGGDNVCVDADSVIWERKDALCKATSDCKYYYDCDNGECTLTRKNKRGENNHVSPCTPNKLIETKCGAGFHLTNSDGSVLITDGPGKLWYCDEYKRCSNIQNGIGYFVNADDSDKPNILCTVSGNAQSCSKVAIGDGVCSSIGQLRETENESGLYAICLDSSGSGIELSEKDGKQIFIGVDQSGGLYGLTPNTVAGNAGAEEASSPFYLAIKIDGNNVKVVKETTPVRYKYINGNRDGYKLIYDRYAAQNANTEPNDICYNSNSPTEYKLVQWINGLENDFADYYIEN